MSGAGNSFVEFQSPSMGLFLGTVGQSQGGFAMAF